jgi:hypothetical protein
MWNKKTKRDKKRCAIIPNNLREPVIYYCWITRAFSILDSIRKLLYASRK